MPYNYRRVLGDALSSIWVYTQTFNFATKRTQSRGACIADSHSVVLAGLPLLDAYGRAERAGRYTKDDRLVNSASTGMLYNRGIFDPWRLIFNRRLIFHLF